MQTLKKIMFQLGKRWGVLISNKQQKPQRRALTLAQLLELVGSNFVAVLDAQDNDY